ncbi:EAL domain-containing protein [Mesorhizobium microcysteis]|uniref:EAL domain-containing protein n=1 Tax=Neoaquamicrobium microcysteis TaxID=2682781 RepID=A0A5D4GUS8_9HYPH|nr:EAL domain-containing protein [Mesorhizobium microcysteis]
MTGQPRSGSDRLILTIKAAYWMALMIIAAMALATYLLLQHMIAAHQRDEDLMTLVSAQKALSQRIVFLANAATQAAPDNRRPLVGSLRQATSQFERNYDEILDRLDQDEAAGEDDARAILFSAPHHLDHFSTSLAANGWRFVSSLEAWLGQSNPSAGYRGGSERAALDEAVANATLIGYSALREKLAAGSRTMLERMLNTHRLLFYATILVIALVAMFIFRPMAEVIRRRTSELVDARNSMAFVAIHDGLTGLHNRTFMHDHFDTLIKSAHRRGERLAVIQIDLDRFKQINDSLGHAAGDYVLVTTAERMRASCRASDICARLGGDEFIMVMPAAGSSEDIDTLARRILGQLNEPIVYEGATIFCGASAGIAVYPVDAENAGDLMVHADLALYAAKKHGGGTFSFFSEELRRELEHRKQLERDIAAAIAHDAFSVYFQPQVSLTNGSIAGVEALVRWHHPERGMISPGEFIPIAEKAGDMPRIGRIVMRKAIQEAASWYRTGIQFGRLAVNVSGTELREPDFTRFLFAMLEDAGLPPQKLSLEIVESVILDDEKTGIASKLRMIRAAGVHLELDDFGTGYASLTHVNPNEIDRLKIDRRFVQNINLNDDNSKIVRAITELARGLGISIIAEGAETEEELSSLLSIGCDQVQGYSIAFPMPDTQAREWLEARSPRRPVLTLVDGARA